MCCVILSKTSLHTLLFRLEYLIGYSLSNVQNLKYTRFGALNYNTTIEANLEEKNKSFFCFSFQFFCYIFFLTWKKHTKTEHKISQGKRYIDGIGVGCFDGIIFVILNICQPIKLKTKKETNKKTVCVCMSGWKRRRQYEKNKIK